METTTVIFDCPISPWLVGALAAIALAAMLLFMRRDCGHLSRRRQAGILSLLTVAGLMLLGLVLCPTLVRTWTDPTKPRCAVLADGSRSMLVADSYTGPAAEWLNKHLGPADASNPRKAKREEIERALLSGGPETWLASLAGDFDVSAWRFASALQDLSLGEGAKPFEVDPQGYSTALGDALDETAAGTGGRAGAPRAVVLISDGAWNTGRDPSEIARRLGQLGTPVFVVGLGDPDPPRDAAVLDLRGPKSALLGDEVLLTARVATTGMGSVRLPVELRSGGKTIDKKTVSTLPSGQPVTVNFTFLPDTPGPRLFEVAIAKQEGERDDSNNSATLAVDVVERKINTLLIDGEPRWDFRFLRNVLERDPAVKVRLCLLRPGVGPISGGEYAGGLPTDKKDLAAYDLIVLGDVPRELLPDDFLTEVTEMVKRRAGALILAAGKRENYRRLAGSPLAAILPVTLEGGLPADAGVSEPFSPELTQEGLAHLVTRLAETSEESETVWSRLPRLRWSASVAGLAPGATALLVHPYRIVGAAKMPLLAVHRVGDGKVMFLGFDETWRWRREVGDEYHYRFWAQAIRWMVKKQFTEGDPRARMSVDRTECDVGESVQIEVYCLGPDGYPLQGAAVWLKVTDGDGKAQRLAMHPAPGGWGVYGLSFTPTKAGTYQMQPIVSAYGEQPLGSTATLQVARVDLEKDFLAQNVRALTAIAEASGGKYLKMTEVDQLPSLLAATKQQRQVTAEYSPCRHWAYYSALAALLGAAWFIRKRSGLA